MSISEENKQNTTIEDSEDLEFEPLTLEDLEADVSDPSMTFTATLHFEFSDIFNAIEHIEVETEDDSDPESEPAEEAPAEESLEEPEPVEPPETFESIAEAESEIESEPEIEPVIEVESEDSQDEAAKLESEQSEPTETEPESKDEADSEPDIEPESEDTTAESETEPEEPSESQDTPEPAHKSPLETLKNQDKGTKKLLLTVIILFAVIAASITGGLVAANSIVDEAKSANQKKIAEKQADIKEVDLKNSLYSMGADQVIEDVAVPTYSMDELYALDLREPTGFTVDDLALITRKGLVGCEEAFVKAEETYGVNCIFLMSIASLESAYGTQMFRPNNMFGYGRTGFSSKQEGIMTVAKGLGARYLNPSGSLYGGSPTLKGVNKRYAANPQWYYKVGKYMQGYYEQLAAAKNGALDKFE